MIDYINQGFQNGVFWFQYGMKVELVAKDLGNCLKIVNIYGPYEDRKYYWENIERIGEMEGFNLVIGGKFNLTISLREVWGSCKTICVK